MWKYVSRRLRDTFERSVNHLDKRSAVGAVSSPGNAVDDQRKPESASEACSREACRWICSRKCWPSTSQGDSDTNSRKWNFEHLNRTWIGAITWSSALVLGWYTSQLINLKLKYHAKHHKSNPSKNNLISPYIQCVNPIYLKSVSKTETFIGNLTPTVYLISNENNGAKEDVGYESGNSQQEDYLGEVLSSIENKLGLAAIENGQHQEGLNLLRSAANRNHAPALYNLGLCYEMGLGVSANEKSAMELYRSAAAYEHPGALYNLGVYYGQGRGGLARDVATGARLLRLAAARGQPDATAALHALGAASVEVPDPPPAPLPYPFYAPTTVPTQSALFVENIGFFPHNQHCEGKA